MANKTIQKSKKSLGIYIHIPFCKSKCSYCDFCSYENTDARIVEHYVNSLILQAEDFSSQCKDYVVNTIYLGGGTPSLLPLKHIAKIIEAIRRLYTINLKKVEVTMEINPATVDTAYLKGLYKIGINRLSIGMQSAINSELHDLGRAHSYEDFEKTYNSARLAGFDNINIDVMYGIPGQTFESFKKTIQKVIELEPEHVSLYALKLEEGTPMYKLQNELSFPDDDLQFEMYCEAVNQFNLANMPPYEVSNFSLKGYESLHNIKYWFCEEYLGLGVAAHSYLKDERFEATKSIKTFVYAMELPKKKIPIYVSYEKSNPSEAAKEYFMLGMRLYQGIEKKHFVAKFGDVVANAYLNPLEKYKQDGYVEIKNGWYSFTPRGMYVSSYIISDIMAAVEDSTGVKTAQLSESGENNDFDGE